MHEPSPVSFSNQRGELEPSAFHQQLRRLESLQMLMVQGSTVVHEVTQFMVKVREELSCLGRDHAEGLQAQQRVEQERTILGEKLLGSERELEQVRLRVAEQDLVLIQLQEQLKRPSSGVTAEELEAVKKEGDAKVAAANLRANELEASLAREREMNETSLRQLRQESANAHSLEIAALKKRLSAVEQQLESERERRARLMEVVKANEVRVIAPQKEKVGA